MDTRRHLYHARINSHLTLEQIGVRTALSPSVLRHIDEGKFELLPSGLYARSYVRTFAVAVGLDPDQALSEIEDLLPGAPDPLPALNAMRPDPAEWAGQLVQWLLSAVAAFVMSGLNRVRARLKAAGTTARAAWVHAHERSAPRLAALKQIEPWSGELILRAEPYVASCRSRLDASAERVKALNSIDLTARLVARAAAVSGDIATAWQSGKIRWLVVPSIERLQASPRLTRWSAGVIDALLLLVVDGFLVLLVSLSSGIPVERLLREAGWALGAFCTIPVALYFVLFGGIAGSTLGGYLCRLITPEHRGGSASAHPHPPLTLGEILRRTVKQ